MQHQENLIFCSFICCATQVAANTRIITSTMQSGQSIDSDQKARSSPFPNRTVTRSRCCPAHNYRLHSNCSVSPLMSIAIFWDRPEASKEDRTQLVLPLAIFTSMGMSVAMSRSWVGLFGEIEIRLWSSERVKMVLRGQTIDLSSRLSGLRTETVISEGSFPPAGALVVLIWHLSLWRLSIWTTSETTSKIFWWLTWQKGLQLWLTMGSLSKLVISSKPSLPLIRNLQMLTSPFSPQVLLTSYTLPTSTTCTQAVKSPQVILLRPQFKAFNYPVFESMVATAGFADDQTACSPLKREQRTLPFLSTFVSAPGEIWLPMLTASTSCTPVPTMATLSMQVPTFRPLRISESPSAAIFTCRYSEFELWTTRSVFRGEGKSLPLLSSRQKGTEIVELGLIISKLSGFLMKTPETGTTSTPSNWDLCPGVFRVTKVLPSLFEVSSLFPSIPTLKSESALSMVMPLGKEYDDRGGNIMVEGMLKGPSMTVFRTGAICLRTWMYLEACPTGFSVFFSMTDRETTSLPGFSAVTLIPAADKNPRVVDWPSSSNPLPIVQRYSKSQLHSSTSDWPTLKVGINLNCAPTTGWSMP